MVLLARQKMAITRKEREYRQRCVRKRWKGKDSLFSVSRRFIESEHELVGLARLVYGSCVSFVHVCFIIETYDVG